MASAQIPPPPPPESQAQGEGAPTPPTQQSFVNISSSNLSIGFINCVGQSKFNLRKQLEIQNYVKNQHLDIVHLEEVKIEAQRLREYEETTLPFPASASSQLPSPVHYLRPACH